MAYSTVANVKKATANADVIPGPNTAAAIVVVNGSNSCSVKLRKGGSGGAIIWESGTMAANARVYDQLPICLSADIYIDMSATGATVYLYGECC